MARPEPATAGPIAVLFGTRPEAIKLAPVILELRRRGTPTTVITTGQHRELVDQVLELFDIRADHDLRLMEHGAGLDQILSRALTGVGELLRERSPAALVVQGDTTSTLAAALAAFHARVPLAHVEAGLRSHDLDLPFPEEMNRRVVSMVARWNFAPTEPAAENLRREGHAGHLEVTGNTVVDALQHIVASSADGPMDPAQAVPSPYVLATAHRRESWGAPIERISLALRDILEARPELHLLFATHPNPAARDPVNRVLAEQPRARVVDALDYRSFLGLLRGSVLTISDSGGVQEEGPTLGIPVLVTRAVTERPEGLKAGAVELVGTDRDRIREAALRLLSDPAARERMARAGR
ncbi:MAG TPA: UDP-N-acetylglucosamine 2-epimerase (non-hydrolyzing), partial [candidate division Zixibacteria bacterium]|nr:UDP-N-acetylglucosamine 2-epimerase (non-hydrolyzing) [candidate division Zixibacteria bacterium]